jgi:hypothetical protein
MTDIDLSDLAADRDGSRPLRGYLARPGGPSAVTLPTCVSASRKCCPVAD